MFQSLPNPEPNIQPGPIRNPWAIFDLVVFGLFFLGLLVLVAPLARLPIIYAIPLQGVFNLTLVAFIAGWVRIVRRSSFKEYVRLFPSGAITKRSLVTLGTVSAIGVLILSSFLPSTSQTPLEKLLTTPSAILTFAIFGVAVAPLLEEIIFRGFVFQALSEIGGAFLAIPVTALVFALLHSPQLAGNWASVILIFFVGCILSVVRHRTNSVIPSFIVHTSYNATLFLLFALSTLSQKLLK